MSLTGHKRERVYARYAITEESVQREGVAKLAALSQTPDPGESLARVIHGEFAEIAHAQ